MRTIHGFGIGCDRMCITAQFQKATASDVHVFGAIRGDLFREMTRSMWQENASGQIQAMEMYIVESKVATHKKITHWLIRIIASDGGRIKRFAPMHTD